MAHGFVWKIRYPYEPLVNHHFSLLYGHENGYTTFADRPTCSILGTREYSARFFEVPKASRRRYSHQEPAIETPRVYPFAITYILCTRVCKQEVRWRNGSEPLATQLDPVQDQVAEGASKIRQFLIWGFPKVGGYPQIINFHNMIFHFGVPPILETPYIYNYIYIHMHICVYILYIYIHVLWIFWNLHFVQAPRCKESYTPWSSWIGVAVLASIIPPFHFRVRLGELTHTKSSNAYNAPPLRAPEKCCLYWYVQ